MLVGNFRRIAARKKQSSQGKWKEYFFHVGVQ
jgi:hypothetical protein